MPSKWGRRLCLSLPNTHSGLTIPTSIYLLLWQPKAWGSAGKGLRDAKQGPSALAPGPAPMTRPASATSAKPPHEGRGGSGVSAHKRLTCGKPHFLVALGKFNIKIGDQGVDVVISLYLQAEGRCERQLFRLHRINVHFLQPGGKRMPTLSTATRSGSWSAASFPWKTTHSRLSRGRGGSLPSGWLPSPPTALPVTSSILSMVGYAQEMVQTHLNVRRTELGRSTFWEWEGRRGKERGEGDE